MKRKSIRLFSLLLAGVLSISSVAFAAEEVADVTAVVDSYFYTSIPKNINMYIDKNGQAETSYRVAVKGDIEANQSIYIIPNSSFLMEKNESSVSAYVTQNKQEWTYTDINPDEYTSETGYIVGNGFDRGKYSGILYFNIMKDYSNQTFDELPDIPTIVMNEEDIDAGTSYLPQGSAVNMSITHEGEDITNKVSYTSSNPNITVDENGLIDTSNASAGEETVITATYTYEKENVVASLYMGKVSLSSGILTQKVLTALVNNDIEEHITVTATKTIVVYDVTINPIRTVTHPGGTFEIEYDTNPAYIKDEIEISTSRYAFTNNDGHISIPTNLEDYYNESAIILSIDGSNRTVPLSVTSGLFDLDGNQTKTWDELLAGENIYEYYSDNSLFSAAYNVGEGILAIDDRYSAQAGGSMLSGANGIVGLIIPHSIVSVDSIAFECNSLEWIRFSKNLKYVGRNAEGVINSYSNIAKGCHKLETVVLPDSLTYLGTSAFENNDGLKTVILPKNLKELPEYCFSGCATLETVVFPSKLTKIGGYAFQDTGITSIELPSSLKELGQRAFRDSKLETITFNEGLEKIGQNAFYDCEGLTSIILPNSLKVLENSAFSDCGNLKNVEINGNITEVGQNIFAYCSNLENVIIHDGLSKITKNMFISCPKLKTVILPNNLQAIEDYVLGSANSLELRVPSSTKSISKYAFNGLFAVYYDGDLEGAPWGATYLNPYKENNYIYNNSSKTILYKYLGTESNIIIDENVKQISNSAFAGNTNIISVTIPEGIEEIGYSAFANCTNLETVNLPEHFINFQNNTFQGTKWLSNKQAENPYVIVNNYLIDGSAVTGDVIIPNNVDGILTNAFSNNQNITSVTIGENITEIPNSAFYNCKNLESISISNSVTRIGDRAFEYAWSYGMTDYNKKVTELVLPTSLTYLGEYAFQGYQMVESIVIPGTLTSISKNAFSNCTSATIIVPASVTSIGASAFNKVKLVVYNGNATGSPWGATQVTNTLQ